MRFYVMKQKSSRFMGILRESESHVKKCPLCGGNFVTYEEPLKYELKGGKLCDFYRFANLILVSDKLLEVFDKNQFVGYHARRTECSSWYDSRHSFDVSKVKLTEIVVDGTCGYLCDVAGQYLKKCEYCGRKLYICGHKVSGVSFRTESWDGSDIFSFKNLRGCPIVTERVKDAIIKNKITNIEFVELRELEM